MLMQDLKMQTVIFHGQRLHHIQPHFYLALSKLYVFWRLLGQWAKILSLGFQCYLVAVTSYVIFAWFIIAFPAAKNIILNCIVFIKISIFRNLFVAQ